MNEKSFIKELMNQLIIDFNTPKFKAEVTFSTILSLYVNDLINYTWNKNKDNTEETFELYSKEFPLKKTSNCSSKNVDFLLKNINTLLLVELKTDNLSYNPEQYENYILTKNKINNEKSAAFLIDDLVQIYKRSRRKDKYLQTYKFLTDIKIIESEKEVFSKINKAYLIYIVPEVVEIHNTYYDKIIPLNQLPVNIFNDSRNDIWNEIVKVGKEIDNDKRIC